MKYKIIVDKKPRTNPSTEKRTYEIDIEELRCKGDIADSLVITKDEDYVMRRLSLSEYHVLSVLSEPVKEPLDNINIELFEGENYIYIQDMEGNKFYAEYLVKNDFTDTYVTKSQMNSAINQTAEKIELSVTKTLEGYATTEKMNSKITQTAEEINSEVNKKVGNDEIISKINQSAEEVSINANKINLNGVVTANKNFKIDTNGKMQCKGASIVDGSISLSGGTIDNPSFVIDQQNKRLYALANYLDVNFNEENKFFDANIQANETTASTSIQSSNYWVSEGVYENKAFVFLEALPLQEKNILMFVDDNGASITLSNNGDTTYIYPNAIYTPLLTQTSREESKKNFEKLENGLDIVKATEIYKYNLRSEEDTKKKHIGFVIGNNYKYSHEITAEDEKGKEIGVDTYSMVSVLWKAVQEQQEQIEKLQNEIKQLKEVANGQD